MSSPSISAIIPTYNGSTFIGQAIQSVLSQTYSGQVEVIVIDDGSTDDTAKIVRSFDPRVRYLSQSNAGPAAARNAGLAAAKGEWIAFLDHDDLWTSEKLQTQLELAQSQKGPCGIYGAVEFFDHRTDAVTSRHCPPLSLDFHGILGFEIIALQTLLCRTEDARKIGGFDASLKGTDDWDFTMRLAAEAKLVGTPKTLARIRIHEQQAGRQRESMYFNCRRVLDKNGFSHGPSCDLCRAARKQARWRINSFYYDHLREEITTGLRKSQWRRVATAFTRAVARTPDQLAATVFRKAVKLAGHASTKPVSSSP